MEKIDILLATYNGEKYLREQLDSILNQSYENFSLIISDDNSKDTTKEILEEYKNKDNRIEVYFHDKNQGVISNFEFLLSKVNDDYFMFSDQDDVWKKDKIEKSLNKLKSQDAMLVYTDLEVVDENLNVIEPSYWRLKGMYHKIKKYNDFNSLYLNNFVTGCTILCKSSIIEEVLPLPKESKYVLHDYWIPLIVSQKYKIAYVDEPLIMYRQHLDNKVGSKKKSDEIKSLDEIRKLFIEVKLEHFNVFINNENKFENEKIKKLNKDALEYYKMLKTKNNFNFRKWGLFIKLYKYEEFNYSIQNFMILNLPWITRILFKFKRR